MNLCANLWHESTNGRHSLSFAALSSSLREGAGGAGVRTIQHTAQKPQRWRAIFIAPTKLRGGYIPPFNQPPKNRNVAGDFHRPYETQNV